MPTRIKTNNPQETPISIFFDCGIGLDCVLTGVFCGCEEPQLILPKMFRTIKTPLINI